jgi:hypothetical protein
MRRSLLRDEIGEDDRHGDRQPVAGAWRENREGTMRTLTAALVTATLIAVPAAAEDYTVSTYEEFFDALGSDRTIIIDGGSLFLSDYFEDFPWEGESTPGEYPAPCAHWESVFDGSSLVLSDLENLTIRGSGDLACSLLTEYRYAYVLEFRNCEGITLENLVIGHEPAGYCMNGVLGFSVCRDVSVDGCELFGCGVEGLTILGCIGFTFVDSEIRDCTYGILTCINSTDLLFEDSVFRDNREFWGVVLDSCNQVEFLDCTFRGNHVDFFGNPLFDFFGCGYVLMRDCTVRENSSAGIFGSRESVTLIDTEIECNTSIQ